MDNQLTATSILSLFETNKNERATFVQNVVNSLDSGEVDVIKLHLQVKCTEALLKDLKENPVYKQTLLQEAEKNGKKFQRFNSEFNVMETGTKYNYLNCNHPVLAKLVAEKFLLDNRIEEIQEWLKKAPADGVDLLFDDEIIRVYPPVKTSTTAVTVKLS